jgi:hypothetical protein
LQEPLGDVVIQGASAEIIRFKQNGSVGIGTTNAQGYKLAVNGSAIFTKAVVKVYTSRPDFVFRKDYKLPSLDSVENYITQNFHLSEMPSADSVARTGIDLGSSQTVMLKKIEELTLYLIEQNKYRQAQDLRLEAQERKLKDQEGRIAQLERSMRTLSAASPSEQAP